MKLSILAAALFTLASSAALAHPGGNSLICKSSANSGSSQKVQLEISRSNGTGWTIPTLKLNLNGKAIDLKTSDEMKSYGDTTHDSPLGVIIVTANNTDEKNTATAYLTVMAIPRTVKALDENGKLKQWSLKDEAAECTDANGKADFQGILRGDLRDEKGTSVNLDTQLLDCELTYDSGMAC